MALEPDSKDWTWVLERPCPECGFDAATVPGTEVATRVRANAAEWLTVLAADPEQLTARRRADRWSPVEYACHVRDVFELYDERLVLMLHEDDPLYPNWDQDATAVAERYDLQAPATVAPQLAAAAERLAARFDGVDAAAWGRTGRRSDGASFTITTFAQYLIHDPIHHLHDVTADLDS